MNARRWPPWDAEATKRPQQRWKTDPNGNHAQGRREALQSANTTRKAKAHVLAVAAEYLVETGVLPAG